VEATFTLLPAIYPSSLECPRYVVNLLTANYTFESNILGREDSYKDLGVKFDTKLKFDLHTNEKISTAYDILFIIKRNFRYLSQESFVILYKALVRSHLEYMLFVCVWSPHYQELIKRIEKVQMRATKLLPQIKDLIVIRNDL